MIVNLRMWTQGWDMDDWVEITRADFARHRTIHSHGTTQICCLLSFLLPELRFADFSGFIFLYYFL
jgi:hypothetical protein